jgi:putative FmdB family regulatory protein
VPIYEYKCENGHLFDVIQKFTDEPLTECQECAAPAVRVLHSPAIHFKGSGFHNTDYGKGKAAAASASAAEGNGGSSDGGESGSSDSASSSDSKSSTDSKSSGKPTAKATD